MIGPLQRKLVRDLWGRKGSLIALLVIMAIGVGAYVGMASVWRDLDGARRDYYRNQRLADFVVDLKRLPQWAVAEHAALPNVEALRGRVRHAVLMELPGAERPIPGAAVSMPRQRQPVLNDIQLRSGGWFSPESDREVILDQAFAEAHDLRPGDRIKALLLDLALRDPDAVEARAEVVRLPNVASTEPQLSVVSDLSRGPYRKRTGVMGLPPGNRLYTPLDGDGKPLVMPDAGLVLTRKLAEILHVQPGDSLRLRPLIGRRAEVEAVVAGVTDSFFGLTAYADIRYLSRLLGEAQAANAVLGRLQPGTTASALLDELKQRPTVVGIGERLRAFTLLEDSFGETMGTMIGVMVIFSGTIAFGAVLNAALVSLSERRREVATLRTLGYRAGRVARLFASEAMLLNGLGLVVGLFAGVGLAHLLSIAYSTELYRFPAVILPGTLAFSAGLVALFVIAAQLILFRMIRRLDWLAVLNVKE